MKQVLIILLIGFMLAGCTKNEVQNFDDSEEAGILNIPDCNVKNPLEELNWLGDVISSITNCSCRVSIFQGEYKKNTVFFILMNDPLCNGVFHVVLLDCNGDKVKEYKHDEFNIYAQEVKIVKTIYTCKDE